MELLTAITRSYDELIDVIKTSIAISIHVDGSVDRTHVDKIYVLLKVVTETGDRKMIFLGIAQQIERGASGLMNAVKKAIIANWDESLYALIMAHVTSICTDGTNMNTGDKHSLWTLFDAECAKYRHLVPFFKIWCSAHRADLSWKDLTKNVVELRNVFDVLSSISTYLHQSGVRTAEIQKVAKENKLTLLSIPKPKDVRWTEWTHKMVMNLLRSWNVLVIYFRNNKECAIAAGFATYLTSYEKMKLIVFAADLLFIFQRFHKSLQNDNLTIVSLAKNIESLKKSLDRLQNEDLVGGWVEQLEKDTILQMTNTKKVNGKMTINMYIFDCVIF